MSQTSQPKRISAKVAAIEKLWRRGVLYWKLDSNQKFLYDTYKSTKEKLLVWVTSRQIGKSWLITTIAAEECLQNNNWKVAYVLPRQNQARKLFKAKINQIFEDCPPELKPTFNAQDNIFTFPSTGSEIHCIGVDSGNIENARGNTFNLILMDECGFMDSAEFDYYYKSVLFPTLNNSPRKLTIMISTPPASAGHTFNRYIQDAEYKGTLITRTIYDCPRFTAKDIEEMAEAVGGVDSTDFKREYLAQRLADTNMLVIPEASEDALKLITREHKKPPFYTCYVAGDFGKLDWTVFLFAYYDFRNDLIVVEDELIFKGKDFTTLHMAQAIKQKEEELWKGKTPEIRVCDNDLSIITELNITHNLTFLATRKDEKHAQINGLRMKILGEKILIHPRCKVTRFHLGSATWNKTRTKYDRGSDGSHFDALDALLYLVRNINYHKNPYPKDYEMPKYNFISPKYVAVQNQSNQILHDIITLRRKRRK